MPNFDDDRQSPEAPTMHPTWHIKAVLTDAANALEKQHSPDEGSHFL